MSRAGRKVFVLLAKGITGHTEVLHPWFAQVPKHNAIPTSSRLLSSMAVPSFLTVYSPLVVVTESKNFLSMTDIIFKKAFES